MRLLLWDIDGTLIRAGSIAREAFANAVGHVVGDHPGEHGISMSGKTDPQIAMEILELLRVSRSDAEVHLPGIIERLEAELADAADALRDGGRVLPGVHELLPLLGREPGVVQSVLTGNIAANAAVKLAAFELDRWLDLSVGAFGSDHRDRSELVPVAVRRVQARHGRTPEEVWIIGDTPNDLACARAGGARALLVATGRIPYDELAGLGADAVLPDLADVRAAAALLLGRTPAGGADSGTG